jgi:hypothetical protein
LCREDAPDAAANTRIEFAVANSSAPSAFAFGGRPRLRFAGPSTTVATLLSAAVCGVAAARATSNAAESEFVVSREWNHVVWSGESRQPPRAMIDNHEKKKKKKKKDSPLIFLSPGRNFRNSNSSPLNTQRFTIQIVLYVQISLAPEHGSFWNSKFPFRPHCSFFFFFFLRAPHNKKHQL